VAPSDALGHEVAKCLIAPTATRERLTAGMFIGPAGQPVGMLEHALAATIAAEPIERKIADAVRGGALASRVAPGDGAAELAARAVASGVISAAEAAVLAAQRELAAAVVRVDDFAQDLGTSLLLANRAPESATNAPRQATPARRAVA